MLGCDSTINVGSGTFTTGSTVDAFVPFLTFNMNATAATFSLGGAIGGSNPLNDVMLTSTNSLTLPAITAATITASTSGSSADLTVSGTQTASARSSTAVSLSSGRQLLLDAPIDITNSSSSNTVAVNLSAAADIVSNGSSGLSTGGAKANLTMDSDDTDGNATKSGVISLNGDTCSTSGGNITLGGGTDPTTMAAIGDAGSASGIYNASTLNAGGGAISLIGIGVDSGSQVRGVWMDVATVETTGNGTISINGTGGGGTNTGDEGDNGVFMYQGSMVSAQNGNISITGTGGNTADDGIRIYDTGSSHESIYTTGTGNITLTGIATKDSNNLYGTGIFMASGSGSSYKHVIGGSTDEGNISFIANSLTFDGYDTITTGASGSVTFKPYSTNTVGVGSGNGTLQVTDAILGTINTNVGLLTIGDSTNTSAIDFNDSSRTFAMPVTFLTNGGNITLDSSVASSNKNITFSDAVALGGNATVNSGTAATDFASTVAGGSYNLTLTGDSLTLGGNMTGTGTLTIEPYSAGTALNINDGTGSGLFLTSAETGYINNAGFSGVTIGNSSDTGNVTIGATSWANPMSFITGNSGSIIVSGNQTGSGSLAFTGPTTLDADVTAANQNITFNSATTLGGNATVNSGTAVTDFASTIAAGSYNLTLTADSLTLGGNMTGTGTLTIQPYSAGTDLHINDGTSSGLYLTGAETGYITNAAFSGITIGNASDTGDMSVGATIWTAPLTLLNGSGNITLSGADHGR